MKLTVFLCSTVALREFNTKLMPNFMACLKVHFTPLNDCSAMQLASVLIVSRYESEKAGQDWS